MGSGARGRQEGPELGVRGERAEKRGRNFGVRHRGVRVRRTERRGSGVGDPGPPRGAEPSGSGARRCGLAGLGVAVAGRGAVGGPLCSVMRTVGGAVPGSEDCEGSRSSVLRTGGFCVLGTEGCVDPGARHGARLHGGAHGGRARAAVPREFLTVLQIFLDFLFLESQPGAPRPPPEQPPSPPPPRHRPRGGSVCRAAKGRAAVGGRRGMGGGQWGRPDGPGRAGASRDAVCRAERGPLPAPSAGADGVAPLLSGGGSVRAAALRRCVRSV